MRGGVRGETGSVLPVLEVRHLCKQYPSFALRDISFSLASGKITGFIGRNGAGKSTTLKALLQIVHPDAGKILFFGEDISACERERIGFVSGGVHFYPNRRLSQITSVTKGFYADWDDAAYADCLHRFELEEQKTPAELSAGMQVKYAIALALSHHAELLILDEPTSGLDPISREDLLDLLMMLSREGKTILFSTHITSDLDRCADDILYIRHGKIRASQPLEKFVRSFRLVSYAEGSLSDAQSALVIGPRRGKDGFRALVMRRDAGAFVSAELSDADLESVMVHLEKEGD